MLKTFLILVMLTCAGALIYLKVNKAPSSPAIPTKVDADQTNNDPLNQDELVFHKFKPIKNDSVTTPATATSTDNTQKAPVRASCTTDLDCEGKMRGIQTASAEKPLAYTQETKRKIDNKDEIELLIENTADQLQQASRDEVYDLIDNLASLQQELDKPAR